MRKVWDQIVEADLDLIGCLFLMALIVVFVTTWMLSTR